MLTKEETEQCVVAGLVEAIGRHEISATQAAEVWSRMTGRIIDWGEVAKHFGWDYDKWKETEARKIYDGELTEQQRADYGNDWNLIFADFIKLADDIDASIDYCVSCGLSFADIRRVVINPHGLRVVKPS